MADPEGGASPKVVKVEDVAEGNLSPKQEKPKEIESNNIPKESESKPKESESKPKESESKPRIDISKWLADNKLTSKEKEIKERNVTIEELADMGADDFKNFADGVGLDTLARKRFLKALQQLKPPSKPSLMVVSQSVDKNLSVNVFGGLGAIQYRSKEDGTSVVVTPQEHEMITQLYEKFIRTALLVQNLNGCSQILEFGTRQCKDDINKKMDYVVQQLGDRKKVLKDDMLQIRSQKGEKLEQQLQLLRSYQSELEDGKKQFEQAIADSSSDVHTRKKKIIALVNELTGRKDVQLVLVTQPKLRLAFENQMVATFLDQLNIDDCDQPSAPLLKLAKISYDSVSLELICDDEVLVNKATEFVVEVALIYTDSKIKPKKRNLKEKAKKKKDKDKEKDKEKGKKSKKKKKKKGSDSDASESGSDADEKESD
jgi:hypothetical protein